MLKLVAAATSALCEKPSPSDWLIACLPARLNLVDRLCFRRMTTGGRATFKCSCSSRRKRGNQPKKMATRARRDIENNPSSTVSFFLFHSSLSHGFGPWQSYEEINRAQCSCVVHTIGAEVSIVTAPSCTQRALSSFSPAPFGLFSSPCGGCG